MRTESKYLCGDNNIRIYDVAIAVKFGLSEALLLGQIQYWVRRKIEEPSKYNGSFVDGRVWVFNSYPQWQEQLPFLGIATIQRAARHLEKEGVLIVGKYNKKKYDRTKWYSIDYDRLDEIMENEPSHQNDATITSKRCDDSDNLMRPIPDTTTETPSKNTLLKEFKGATSKDDCTTPTRTIRKENNGIDYAILERQIEKACLEEEIDDKSKICDITEIIEYYFKIYFDTFGEEHTRLNQGVMRDVVQKIDYSPSDMIDGVDVGEYECMIDKHFKNSIQRL